MLSYESGLCRLVSPGTVYGTNVRELATVCAVLVERKSFQRESRESGNQSVRTLFLAKPVLWNATSLFMVQEILFL